MSNTHKRSKNKWNSQRISKRFKNRHLNDEYREKYISPKENVNSYIKRYNNEPTELTDSTFVHSEIIPSWNCKRCTFYNIDSNSYCAICELPFNENYTQTNTNHITMAHYLHPILTQIEAKHDDFDEQIQFAIQLSLQNISDSDDTDDTASNCTTKTDHSNINHKKGKRKTSRISFASYWKELSEYNKMFDKNLQHIIKQNKWRMKRDKDEDNMLWSNHGKINNNTFTLIKCHETLMRAVPSIDNIYKWLSGHWNVKDFSIRNVINYPVLQKFIAHGTLKTNRLQIVYHGTLSNNEESIINQGLVVGGTKGVPIRNGSVHGRGIYCSPNLKTASWYQRGSLFICLVRSNKCNKAGNIYVVPNDDDILPIYLASFSYSDAFLKNNSIFKFKPGWKPLNMNAKANKERKIKRKWSAYHKLMNSNMK